MNLLQRAPIEKAGNDYGSLNTCSMVMRMACIWHWLCIGRLVFEAWDRLQSKDLPLVVQGVSK